MNELDKVIERIKEQFDDIDKKILEINKSLREQKEGPEITE